MARHYGIISAVPQREVASMDVSSDGAGINLRWTVFGPGAPKVSSVLTTAAPGLCVSSTASTLPNFFAACGNTDALVMAESCDAAGVPTDDPTFAVQRQGPFISTNFQYLPSENQSVGERFLFPVGDLMRGTVVYIAAVGGDAQVTPTIGAPAPPGLPAINVVANTVVKMPLQKGNTQVALAAVPGQRILVVLAVNIGAANPQFAFWEETLILPVGPAFTPPPRG